MDAGAVTEPVNLADIAVLHRPQIGRPLWKTIRRHRVLLLCTWCLLSSLAFLLGPLAPRSYVVRGNAQVTMRSSDKLPALAALPDPILREMRASAEPLDVAMSLEREDSTKFRLQLAATDASRDKAFVRIHAFAAEFARRLREQAADLVAPNQASLQRQAALADPAIEVTPLAITSNAAWPRFPALWMIYSAGAAAALAITWLLALTLHKTDHTFHEVSEALVLMDVPMLGAISEIRGTGSARRAGLWRKFRPLAILLFLIMAALSAGVCYRHMADAGFIDRANARPLDVLTLGSLAEGKP